jgi:uncharacterized membrane protein
MRKTTKVITAILICVAVLVLAYAVLSADPASDPDEHMGMWDGRATYSSTEIGMIMVASAMIAIALAFILIKEEYEPLPPSMAPPEIPPPPPQGHAEPLPPPEEEATAPEKAETREEISPDERARETYLVLRLLTGDERAMFKALMDSGGEALQKDLIKTTRMSNAKVSRVLDRLAEKGVISKERWGATNKIRIRLTG